jgi:hypothetical protein
MIHLSAAQQAQLNMGQELLVSIFDLQGKPIDFGCLTVPQVDAAIAEGKRVYTAVIAAKAGGSAKGGLTTSAPTLSGPQTQDPKVK